MEAYHHVPLPAANLFLLDLQLHLCLISPNSANLCSPVLQTAVEIRITELWPVDKVARASRLFSSFFV